MSIFICQFCGSERKNKRSLVAHISFCKSNPDRSEHDHSKAGSLGNKKSRLAQKKNLQVAKNLYKSSPKKCKLCDKFIPFNKRGNTFCSHSCAASCTNRIRDCKPGPKSGAVSKIKIGKVSFPRKLIKSLCVKYTTHRQKCKHCECYFWAESKRKTCSEKCRKAIHSKIARNNPKMGGNKNTRAWGWYESQIAGKVWLESSWEYKVASSLDSNNVKWSRPNFLPYGCKKYFPDFYLHEYNVYLDPKNPYLQQLDSEKIKMVQEQNKVNVLLLNKNQLDWQVIKELINAP